MLHVPFWICSAMRGEPNWRSTFPQEKQIVILDGTQQEIQKNTTVYNFDTIGVDGKPEV
jgi:hypothetical protein